MYYIVESDKPFEQASSDLRQAVSRHGFGVLHVHNLDNTLRIRKFTPKAHEIFGLVEHDVGRYLATFNHRLAYSTLSEDIERVHADGSRVEKEVRSLDGAWYFDLMRREAEVTDIRDTLVFGQAITEGLRGLDPSSAVAAMADTAEICGCNGVCKGAITGAITAQGLTTLDTVRGVTKASASCGSCTPLVEQLLKLTLGDGFTAETGPASVCKCTHHGHAIVRDGHRQDELSMAILAPEWEVRRAART